MGGGETEQFSVLAKVIADTGVVGVIPSYMCGSLPETVTTVAYAINPSLKLLNAGEEPGFATPEELIGPLEKSLMTEAEFYDETVFGVLMDQATGLDPDYRVAHCEKEMLWSEWVASDYNTLDLIVNEDNIIVYRLMDSCYLAIVNGANSVRGDDAIDIRNTYYLQIRSAK